MQGNLLGNEWQAPYEFIAKDQKTDRPIQVMSCLASDADHLIKKMKTSLGSWKKLPNHKPRH